MRNGVRAGIFFLTFLICSWHAKHAVAYWFAEDLTQAEFNGLPPTCKWFSSSRSGSGGRFAGDTATAPPRPDHLLPGGGHFCVGLVAMMRSTGKPKDKALEWMKTAAGEIRYTHSQMAENDRSFAWASAYYGKALYGSGDRQKAFDVWRTAIRARSAERESYLLMSQALVAEQRFDEALRLLLEFDAVKEQPWPDAEYFLGYVYYKMGKLDDALKHLEQARKLGYPNDGLRQKIRNRAGSGK